MRSEHQIVSVYKLQCLYFDHCRWNCVKMNNVPYSDSNPPNAPKKAKPRRNLRLDIPSFTLPAEVEEEKAQEWKALAESGMVHPKFLQYNPEDVLEINDIDSLMEMRGWYLPSSQPRNFFEAAYLKIMLEAIDNRLYIL